MRKTLRFSVCALFLALAVAVTQIPAKQVEADAKPVQSQDTDFLMNGTTLVKYTGTAQTVSVPASVTAIAEEAFAGNTDMETLIFKGNQLESIAYRAFAECTGLKEVKIPDTVTTLGNGAFSNCTALEKVTLGTEVRNLGIGVFAGCTALKKVEVAVDNTCFMMEDDCLYSKDKSTLYLMLPGREKETYSMPSTVIDIAEYALWDCENVKSISLSNNLEQVPDYAFANCKSLTAVTIPYSVKSIGIKAFADCVNLGSISVPSTVAYIHSTAFDGCAKLKIVADTGTVAAEYYKEWLKNNQAEYEDTGSTGEDTGSTGGDTGSTGDNSPKDENDKPQITEPDNRNVLGSTYVVANTAVVFIEERDDLIHESEGTSQVEGEISIVDENGVKSWEIPKYKVAFGTILADQAFYRSKEAKGYKFPENITEIGEFTFARSNIEEAVIPRGVTTIGYGAFYHCDYLREVEIPSTVTYIAPKAFENTLWLESWLNGNGEEDYLIVGNGILLAYRGEGGNLEIPDTVKRIAPEVFAGNKTVYSVNIPDSVIEIGEDAFSGCLNLQTVTGGKNIKYIKDRAFYGCGLQTAHVGEKVEYLGMGCFDFSKTAFSASGKVVVFDGKELPETSHELTAERLSNEEARNYALGDTLFAIVDKKVFAEDLEGTVLDVNGYGMQGVIAYISTLDPNTVTCMATTYTKEEFADVYIPEYIMIDGKNYKVEGKESISLFGDGRNYEAGTLQIVNGSEMLAGSDISGELEGNTGAYEVKITDSKTALNDIGAAYEAVYREELPENSLCIDVTMVDLESGIPITKTGKQALRLTVTLPERFVDNSLRVLSMDRNGQVINLSYSREGNTVTFATNTPNPVVFCGVGSVVPDGRMDESPDTGDYAVHPKYFFAAGIASLGIATLFIKKKKVKKY